MRPSKEVKATRTILAHIVTIGILHAGVCAVSVECQAQSGTRPVVLTIPYVANPSETLPYPCGALSAEAIADLVSSYDCMIVERTMSYNIGLENTIKRLGAISSNTAPLRTVAADYSIVADFITEKDGTVKDGYIRFQDLAASRDAPAEKVRFSAPNVNGLPQLIASKIADRLALRRREPSGTNTGKAGTRRKTWIVLPFLRYDKNLENTPSQDPLATAAELTLDSTKKIGKLADRQALESVVKELHLSSDIGFDEGTACYLSRIVDAQRLVIGMVASPPGGGRRVIIHLVDSETALVIASLLATSPSESELGETVSELASKLPDLDCDLPEVADSTSAQRQREARFYLAWNNEHVVAWNLSDGMSTYRLSSAPYVQQNAEAAYLLTKEDPLAVCEAAWSMRNLLSFHHQPIPPYPKPFVERVARVINGILEPIDPEEIARAYQGGSLVGMAREGQRTRAPLLMRAEALMVLQSYEKAAALAEEHLRRFPNDKPCRALTVAATCHLRLGNTGRAEELLKEVLAKQGPEREWEDERIGILQAEVASAKPDKRARYQAVKSLFTKLQEVKNPDDMAAYFDLMPEMEGTEEALKILAYWLDYDPSNSRFPRGTSAYNMMKQGECLLALGRKADAGRRFRDVKACCEASEDTLLGGGMPPLMAQAYRKAGDHLAAIEKEIGPVKELWKTAADVRSFPDQYAIYLIPVGNIQTGLISEAAIRTGAYFGARARMLESIPIPAAVPSKGDYRYDTKPFMAAILQHARIPDNAVLVAFINEPYTPSGIIGYTCSSPNDGMPLFAEGPTSIGPREPKLHEIVRSVIGAFRASYSKQEPGQTFPLATGKCPYRPCIFASWLAGSDLDLRIAMCPACQESYKKVDFDKAHNDLMGYLKKAGATTVPAKKGSDK